MSKNATLLVLLATFAWLALSTVAHAQVHVEISGVEPEVETNIRASLDLIRHGAREDLSDAAIRRLFGRARGQIRNAMRPFGYYRPQIEPHLEQRDDAWLASFQIDPGEPVLVVEVDVQLHGDGATEPRLLEVIGQSPLRPGRRLRHPEHDRLRADLQSTAATLGYLEARFSERKLEVDPAQHTARVVLHLQTGPRYRFGVVSVEQDILDERFLARIVDVREGEPYDANRLLRAQYRLTDSGYFGSVIATTGTPDAESLTIPVHIETVPVRRQRIRLGVGYATDTQLRGSAAVDWRRLNRAGHTAGSELRLARTLSDLSTHYRIPMRDPLTERLLIRGAITEEDLGDLVSRRARLGVSHVTIRGGGWQRTLFTDLLDEHTRVPDAPNLSDTLVIPGVAMEKLHADDILFPTHGFRVRAEARGSHQVLGASNDFLRLEFEANQVFARGENWRFFARSRLGIGIVEGFATLPASQRFFAGGDQSVRGYGYNSLGPTDDAGNVIGGRHLIFGSLEAERRVWGRVALAGFVDAGNALDVFEFDLEVSAGLGVHVQTPIGTLRLSVARSVTESRGLRYHLTLRPDL
jgi:translocation and assembly module TamA